MFNDFLTTTLQVVIVLNVAGLVAYFWLGARRRPNATPHPGMAVQAASTSALPSNDPCGDASRGSLWDKLVHRTSSAVPAVAGSRQHARGAAESLDASLSRLRRVLDGYRHSLG